MDAGETVTVSIQLSFKPGFNDGTFVFMSYANQVILDGTNVTDFSGPISTNPGYFPAIGDGAFITDQNAHTLKFTIDPDAPSDSPHPYPSDPSLETGPFLELEPSIDGSVSGASSVSTFLSCSLAIPTTWSSPPAVSP